MTARAVKEGDFVQVMWIEGVGTNATEVWRSAKARDYPAPDGSLMIEVLELGPGRSLYAVGDIVLAHQKEWR